MNTKNPSSSPLSDSMSVEQAELLKRIQSYRFDPPNAVQTFAARLQKETGWTSNFVERAIEEYRRYCFIFASTKQPVAPSDAIDQVWHLHLLYTRSYWEDFCRDVLGNALHHQPATGVEGDGARFGEWYEETRRRYQQFFGEPPSDIWPDAKSLSQSKKPQYRRVECNTNFIIPRAGFYAIVLVVVALWVVLIFIWVVQHRG